MADEKESLLEQLKKDKEIFEFLSPEEQEDKLWEMTNLHPSDTGLKMTIWCNPKGNAKHDTRIKVCMSYGNKMTPYNTAVVGVRPKPHLIHGELKPADLKAVYKWIELNKVAIIKFWDNEYGAGKFVKSLISLNEKPKK